jgi:hypothetical protein
LIVLPSTLRLTHSLGVLLTRRRCTRSRAGNPPSTEAVGSPGVSLPLRLTRDRYEDGYRRNKSPAPCVDAQNRVTKGHGSSPVEKLVPFCDLPHRENRKRGHHANQPKNREKSGHALAPFRHRHPVALDARQTVGFKSAPPVLTLKGIAEQPRERTLRIATVRVVDQLASWRRLGRGPGGGGIEVTCGHCDQRQHEYRFHLALPCLLDRRAMLQRRARERRFTPWRISFRELTAGRCRSRANDNRWQHDVRSLFKRRADPHRNGRVMVF